MKKVLSIMLALVMCFALAMPAFAADETLGDVNGGNDVVTTAPANGDSETPDFGLNGDVMAAIQEVLTKLGETQFGDFTEFATAFRNALAGVIGEDAMNQIADIINSNAFLKWLASVYTHSDMQTTTSEPETTEAPVSETTTEAEKETAPMADIVPTGDSAVALAVFATVSVAAAAAFVCTKKKA